MKVTWQQPPARGLGPTVLVETEGTVSRFVLKPHKDNIYLLEDVRPKIWRQRRVKRSGRAFATG